MIEYSHPHERRSTLERAIAEQRDGGASYYRSLGMPEDLITKVIERRARKLGRPHNNLDQANDERRRERDQLKTSTNAAELF